MLSKFLCKIVLLIAVVAALSVPALRAQVAGQYIVRFQDDPVVGYLRRQGANGMKARLESLDAAAYRSRLLVQQANVRRFIEALPQGAVAAQMDTVFNGMAVSLRPEDVTAVSQYPGVAEVTPSILYHKLLDAALPLIKVPTAWTNPGVGGEANAGRGIRIAIIDTGIDNTHPMLQDASLTAPAGFPRFTAPTSTCLASDQRFTNSKVIVARNYVSMLSSRDPNCDAQDRDGHGTFNAGISAGRRAAAPQASLSGVAPKAFLGNYKVFGTPGVNDNATNSAIIKAIDDAVKDGMDILNLSLGSNTADTNLAQAAANAVNAGVTVVVAAGNSGPGTGTISSPGTSPAVITVGATTNSRILANLLAITANVTVPPQLQQLGARPGNGPAITSSVGPAPLVDVLTVDVSGNACSALPGSSLSGQFVLVRRGSCTFATKIQNAAAAGASAVLIYNDQANQPAILMDVGSANQIPSAMLGNADGLALAQFLASGNTGAQATLQPQQTSIAVTPNLVSTFSSEGPSSDFGIKPDLVAPGENIYSATQSNFPGGEQYDPTGFVMGSGTSFATPMVAGASALLKQASPFLTPAQIKSALVNTAAKLVNSFTEGFAGVLLRGNGLLDAAAAVNTPVVVSPASISFGANSPGTILNSTTVLNITNVSTASDSFTVTTMAVAGSGQVTVSALPSSVTLSAGQSTAISVTAVSAQPINGTVEGYLTIRSDSSQTSITVPYWGTFRNPGVNPSGVVNAASFTAGPPTVTAGALISIFGSDLADSTESAVTLPLPLSLGGATVTIAGEKAPLLFASPTQINAQVPFDLAGRTLASLVVSLNGISAPPALISLLPASPGIFTISQTGTGQGAILHASNSAPVTAANPARAGEFLEIFATGLGSANPSVATGSVASSVPISKTLLTPSATVAESPAAVTFSGLAPGFVGLYQINIQVPSGVSAGEQVLSLSVNGVASNPVLLPVGN